MLGSIKKHEIVKIYSLSNHCIYCVSLSVYNSIINHYAVQKARREEDRFSEMNDSLMRSFQQYLSLFVLQDLSNTN